jgi:hypothetical protein
MRKFLVAAVVMVTLGAIWSAPAEAGADNARPFKVTLESDFFVNGICDDGSPLQVIVGTGQATHLGRFSINGSICLSEVPQPGTVTWTAANGDGITIAFFPDVGPVGPDGSASIRLVSLGETGTGRFTNVHFDGGDPEGTVWFADPFGLTGHLEAEGSGLISYDASDRSN